jgi:thiosulfate dehydrogenase
MHRPVSRSALAMAMLAAGAATAQGPESIHDGQLLITATSTLIGPEVADPDMRYAGNNLACANCHMDAGRRSGALALVGVSTKYPKAMPDGSSESLADRINGCMERSMNGRALPEDGAAMLAIVSYLEKLTTDAGSFGTLAEDPAPLPTAATPPDPARGAMLYASQCAGCHATDGGGQRKGLPGDALGYLHPPVWGPDSFNAAAGMHRLTTLAAFIHANMPLTAIVGAPVLGEQDAWDIAAFIEAQPRPPAPAGMTAEQH